MSDSAAAEEKRSTGAATEEETTGAKLDEEIKEKFIKLLFYNYVDNGLTTSSSITILQILTDRKTMQLFSLLTFDLYNDLITNTSIHKKIDTLNFDHEGATTGVERKVARCSLIMNSQDEILDIVEDHSEQLLAIQRVKETMSNMSTKTMCEIYAHLVSINESETYEEGKEKYSPESKGEDHLAKCHQVELANYLVRMKRITDFLLSIPSSSSLSLSKGQKEEVKNGFRRLVKVFDNLASSSEYNTMDTSLRKVAVFSDIFFPLCHDSFIDRCNEFLPPDINKIILDGLVPSIEEVIVNLSDEPLLRITTSVTRAVEEIEKKKKFAGWRKNFVYVIVFHVVIILLVIFLSIYFPKMTF